MAAERGSGKLRLTEAQVRWLNDPRPYFRRFKDRTGEALIDKGAIVVTESGGGSFRAAYEITPAGRAALASHTKEG